MTHELAAIAEQRAWHHDPDHYSTQMIHYLAKEYDLPDIKSQFRLVEGFHCNFFGHDHFESEIREEITSVTALVAVLEDLRHRPTQHYRIEGPHDLYVVCQLTRCYDLKDGDESTEGFTTARQRAHMARRWRHPRRTHRSRPSRTKGAEASPPQASPG